MTAADILRMIETVDPDDTGKLDEIDIRVQWHINPEMGYHLSDVPGSGLRIVKNHHYAFKPRPPKYTRSRDALKGIRPDGWKFKIWSDGACEWWKWPTSPENISLKTEELAELHAIIQAIEHERGGK